jgi:hypothetical protein
MTDGMQDLNDKENIFPGSKKSLNSFGNTALFIYMFISLSVISI